MSMTLTDNCLIVTKYMDNITAEYMDNFAAWYVDTLVVGPLHGLVVKYVHALAVRPVNAAKVTSGTAQPTEEVVSLSRSNTPTMGYSYSMMAHMNCSMAIARDVDNLAPRCANNIVVGHVDAFVIGSRITARPTSGPDQSPVANITS